MKEKEAERQRRHQQRCTPKYWSVYLPIQPSLFFFFFLFFFAVVAADVIILIVVIAALAIGRPELQKDKTLPSKEQRGTRVPSIQWLSSWLHRE